MAKYLEGLEFIQLVQPGGADTTLMQVRRPHVIGRVAYIDQKNNEEVERFMVQLANGSTLAKVSGYSIFVLPGGTLDNEQSGDEDILETLQRMAGYVLSEVIPSRGQRCLRYKEGINYDSEKAAQVEKGRYYKQLREARRAAKLSQEEE